MKDQRKSTENHKNAIDSEGRSKIDKVLTYLENLGIEYSISYHPPAPTIEIAKQYWDDGEALHCKNLFFRNHKGNRHYLVLLDCDSNMNIQGLEKYLKQGKLTFASEARMEKHLGVKPGSVSFFALINNESKSVKLFLDRELLNADRISFHPNDNRASVVISGKDFKFLLDHFGNEYELMELTQ